MAIFTEVNITHASQTKNSVSKNETQTNQANSIILFSCLFHQPGDLFQVCRSPLTHFGMLLGEFFHYFLLFGYRVTGIVSDLGVHIIACMVIEPSFIENSIDEQAANPVNYYTSHLSKTNKQTTTTTNNNLSLIHI